MATRNVNLVNAIAQTTARTARTNGAAIRIGKVVSAGAAGVMVVTIGGVNSRCRYMKHYTGVAGDQVAVLVTGDLWIVLGAIVY